MPRYIDADRVLEREEKEYKRFLKQCRSTTLMMFARSFHVAFRRIVQRSVAVHVAPVVYSEWEINPDGYYPYCRSCKGEPKGGEMTDFCPHCGAIMKGVKKQL